VHLWTLDNVTEQETYDASSLIRAQRVGSQHVPLLVQNLAALNWRNPPRLWLVTEGSMAVGVSGELPQIQNASMWGIGRTVAPEHPELCATLVDLGAAPNPLEARELARQISQNGEEDRIALRGKDRYLARLASRQRGSPKHFRSGHSG
jgi:hypothetical protein